MLLNQETEERSLPSDNEDETPQEPEKPVEEETEEPEEPEEEPQTTADLSEEDEPQPLPTTGDLLVILTHSDISLFQNSACFLESYTLTPTLLAEFGRRIASHDCRS
jgi:hypothetical protein